MLRRIYHSRLIRRALLWGFVSGLTAAVLSVAAFMIAVRCVQQDFAPVDRPLPADLVTSIDGIPKYRRAEDSTYLTFTEWYLVFNPQEYATFIAREHPSRFPYFRAIGQIWSGYTQTYAMTRRHYPFNGGYNLMLGVISTSSTFEFAIKGAYEKTVGRVFEWTASARTPEDEFAAQMAREYGDFIPTQPWFEYPFGRKFRELWSTNTLFGRNFLRKTERKFFLSLEYGVKAIYAGVIRFASRSVFGVADTEIYLSAHALSDATLARPGVRPVRMLGPGHWIITVPHYQGFTDTVPLLARDGVQFDEVAGNDEIMLTLVAPSTWTYNLSGGRPLFAMTLLTGPELKRVAVQVPVKDLGPVLRDLDAKGLRLEHLFDY